MSNLTTIIVTGASRGLGRAVALHSIKHFNSNVLAIARSEKDLNSLKSQVENEFGHKGRLEFVVGDVTDSSVVDAAVKQCLSSWGRLDGIVANAGVLEPIGTIANTKLEDWKRHFDVNFFSIISFLQNAIPHLRESKGRVIAIASGAASYAYYGWGAYCTSKAALNSLISNLAVEEPDITSIAVRPGVMDTPMQKLVRAEHMLKEDYDKFVSLYENKTLVNPEEPAYVISGLVTGQPSKELNGKFYSWDDPELAGYRKK
ncbi:5769_t:CDS:2 [Ambispora leptoticha]|uniref:5769_t:CDS:1 n=1 Tax=Ambispora leptoticha TaxID=144679 RepID=A0A9N8YPU6_9GLOM|nr:5769_t:CDS:2 [Ambispora leptoticha]